MANVASSLDTQPQFIDDINKDVRKGEIKIPKFQRRFVWNIDQAINLLDSIAHNYPIGSLLFWQTHTKIPSERNIGDFKLPKTKDIVPTTYVLDGQQRLTVIYSALATDADGKMNFAYNLETSKFEEYIETEQQSLFPNYHIFPLRYLYDMTKLLNFRTELQNHPSGNVFGPRLDKLVEVVRSYKIPVVTLSDLTIEEVCPIFERINSSGTRLSVYDLMVAATWSPSFDLNDTYTSITDFLDPKGFDEIEGDTVLKCLAAVHSRQVNRNDVLKLREVKPNMDDLARRTKDALSRAVDLLVSEFKVHSISYLPYEAILVILCAIVANHKTLDAAQIKRLRQWFWRSSLNERYRGAADSFITNDIKLVEDYVVFAKGNADLFGQAPNEATLCTVGFRIDSSRSKAFILAIASNNPRNITNSAVIDTYAALSGYNKKQYHHIYPRAYLKRNSSLGNYDALANICMLSASENIKISDSAPSDYLPHYYRAHGNRALEVFNSNFIPGASKVDYTNLTYTSFLNERAAMLRDALMILCEGEHL